jgi:hypothetical protein
MLEANGNSDQKEVERLGMEYKNIYIEVRNKAKKEFWNHKKNNWKIASFLVVFLFVINYLLSGRVTLFHKVTINKLIIIICMLYREPIILY